MKVSNEKRIKIHMLRDCDLDKITDGKRYQLSDMVKADCDDCKGCSACCHDMGNSIFRKTESLPHTGGLCRRGGHLARPYLRYDR